MGHPCMTSKEHEALNEKRTSVPSPTMPVYVNKNIYTAVFTAWSTLCLSCSARIALLHYFVPRRMQNKAVEVKPSVTAQWWNSLLAVEPILDYRYCCRRVDALWDCLQLELINLWISLIHITSGKFLPLAVLGTIPHKRQMGLQISTAPGLFLGKGNPGDPRGGVGWIYGSLRNYFHINCHVQERAFPHFLMFKTRLVFSKTSSRTPVLHAAHVKWLLLLENSSIVFTYKGMTSFPKCSIFSGLKTWTEKPESTLKFGV